MQFYVALDSDKNHKISSGSKLGSRIEISLLPNINEDIEVELKGTTTSTIRTGSTGFQVEAKFSSVPGEVSLEPDVTYRVIFNRETGVAHFSNI